MGYVSPYKSRFWMKLVSRFVNFWRVLIDILLFYRSRLPSPDSSGCLSKGNFWMIRGEREDGTMLNDV